MGVGFLHLLKSLALDNVVQELRRAGNLGFLDIKFEVNDITILNDVFFALHF